MRQMRIAKITGIRNAEIVILKIQEYIRTEIDEIFNIEHFFLSKAMKN